MPYLRSVVTLLLLGSVVCAEDWPQWLGPRRDGSTTEKVAPWKQPLKVLWRQEVGEGNSSPVVVGERVFLHARTKGKNEESLTAFAAADGKPLWKTAYPRAPFVYLYGNGPRATPTVANGKVYTYGITGLLTCFNAETGDQVWQVDTLKQFKAPNLKFGFSCSPLIEDGKLLLNVGAKGASLVAFNPKDGAVVWKVRDDGASYSSPILLGHGEQRQAVFLTAEGLVGVALKDGSSFWQIPMVDKLFESSITPVRAGDFVFASSIMFGGLAAKLDESQAIPRAKKVWEKPEYNCYFSTPVPVGTQHLYLVTGTKPSLAMLLPNKKNPPQADLRCIDIATGKELWSKPKVGTYHASLTRTADNKLLLLEEGGDLVLLDPDPKEYRELARARICGNTWAHPAIAQGRLYIRDNNELVCVELPTR